MAGDKTTCPICAMMDWADESKETAIWSALSLGIASGITGIGLIQAAMCPGHLESAAKALEEADEKIGQFEKQYGQPQN